MSLGDRANAASLLLYNAQQVDMVASKRIAADKSFIRHPPHGGSAEPKLGPLLYDVSEYLHVS
jgi:hypothetical protein